MKKIKIIFFICMIVILMVGTSYGASNTYQIKMNLMQDKVLMGETISIPVTIENIDMENGVVALSAILWYDKDIWEEPVISSASNWTTPIVVEDLIQTTTSNMQPVKENQEIMIITFKVKEDVPIGQTEIRLSNFEASDGETTIYSDATSVKINISDKKTEMANILLNNDWLHQRDMIISLIIGIVTIMIIILITIYYIQHHTAKEKSDILYEEVEGIPEEVKQVEKE